MAAIGAAREPSWAWMSLVGIELVVVDEYDLGADHPWCGVVDGPDVHPLRRSMDLRRCRWVAEEGVPIHG